MNQQSTIAEQAVPAVSETALPSAAEIKALLIRHGCFRYRPWLAFASCLLHLLLAGACFLLAAATPFYLAPLLFIAGSMFFYRIGFVMHDAAHCGIADTPGINAAAAWLAAFLLGEFVSGWTIVHNNHHAWANCPEKENGQTNRWNSSLQFKRRSSAWLSLFLLLRRGRWVFPVSLLFLGIRDGYYAYRQNRKIFYLQLVLVLISHGLQIGFFVYLAGAWGVLLYFLHTHIGFLYLNLVFTGNHYDLPVFSLEQTKRLSFIERQIGATRNYSGGWLTHYWSGGLDKHIEHHLFPSLPRHRLGRAAVVIRQSLAGKELAYSELPFWQSIGRAVDFHLIK